MVGLNRGALRWLVAAVAGLLASWMLVPALVPVYDGLGNPDEPYRYVQPPPDAKSTKPPTPAKSIVDVVKGTNRAQYVNSAEQGPQVSIYLPAGSLGVPSGATRLTLQGTPLAPQSPLPTDGRIISNVYRISVTTETGDVVPITGRGAQAASIQMRAPSARQPGPVFERRTATGWEQLPTGRAGTDVYATLQVTAFGEFALVQLDHPTPGDGGGGINVGLLVGGIAVLGFALTVVGIRAHRSSRG